MELETLIRETLREHAADAPTRVPDVVARPRRWLSAGLAAVLVAGLAVGAVALRSDHSHTPSAIPTAPQVPAGYKPISYHGITLAVPSSLPVLNTKCGTGNSAYVLADANNMALCPAVRDDPEISLEPGHVLVDSLAGNPGAIRRRPVIIDGKRGVEAVFNAKYRAGPLLSSGALVLPDPGVGVYVHADWATVQKVLNSVHVTPTNWLGCPDRHPTPDPQRGAALIPPAPSSASECVYFGEGVGAKRSQPEWLVASGALSALNRERLVTYLNGLPRHPVSSAAFPARTSSVLVVFRYADGSTFRLAAGSYPSDSWYAMNGDSFVDDPPDGRISQLLFRYQP